MNKDVVGSIALWSFVVAAVFAAIGFGITRIPNPSWLPQLFLGLAGILSAVFVVCLILFLSTRGGGV